MYCILSAFRQHWTIKCLAQNSSNNASAMWFFKGSFGKPVPSCHVYAAHFPPALGTIKLTSQNSSNTRHHHCASSRVNCLGKSVPSYRVYTAGEQSNELHGTAAIKHHQWASQRVVSVSTLILAMHCILSAFRQHWTIKCLAQNSSNKASQCASSRIFSVSQFLLAMCILPVNNQMNCTKQQQYKAPSLCFFKG